MLLYTFETIKYSPYTAIIPNPTNPEHKLTFWKITYTINGEAEIFLNGKPKILRNTTLLFVRPYDVLQNYSFRPANGYKHRDIYISDEKLQKICEALPINPYKKLHKKSVYFEVPRIQTENLEFLLNSFPLNSEEKNAYLETLHQTVVTDCLTMFLQSAEKKQIPPMWLSKLADRTTLDEFLQEDTKYFLKDVHYSHRHICRIFQKYYGMSPSEYLTKAKIIQSINYLMKKELLISDIAQMLGFGTQSGFIKAFKNYFNLSPNAWRKKYLADKTSEGTGKFGPESKVL